MSEFNDESYLDGQIRKQYKETIKTNSKQTIVIENLVPVDDLLNPLLIGQPIRKIQQAVKEGKLDYPTIIAFYLNRINHHVDKNAILEINPECYEEAKEKTYDDDHDMIYGLPIIIKGNIGTKNMHTTAGVAALRNLICDDDAEIIKNLKSKGAIILGKANLSEWANFMSTESSNGYSALGGQTKNPYGHFDVGGSSSGSGVSAACEFAPLTIGTETAGSIIYPSSQNSVVGLKPSLGLVPQDRIIPISESHDTAGPITKCVEDAYYLLAGMVKELETANFKTSNLQNKKIGVVVNKSILEMYRKDDGDIMNAIKADLEGCESIVTNIELCDSAFETQVYNILKYEFREGIKSYLNNFAPTYPIQSVGDVILFNEDDMDRYAPYNHEIIHQSATETFDLKTITQQINDNQKMTSGALDIAFKEVDFLVTLSNYCTSVYAPAGYPAVTVPAGYRLTGEPIGVTFIGPNHQDVNLLEVAYAYEQFTQHRTGPREVL